MSNATPIQGHYDTSSVFVAVIGRPNVGKSSLTNLLVGEKVAIVTSKPQTTRTRITGVITRGPLQYVLLDTPGVHKAHNKLGKRMDFDSDILVRLAWRNQPMQWLPTKVHYPLDGLSHFRLLHDNALISKMHAKLFFGMLLRAPLILWRRWRG